MEPQEKKRKISNESSGSITELQVGITEYVFQENTGFNGLLKQRFSDFQVNEIDLNGDVVVLKQIISNPVDTQTTPASPVNPDGNPSGNSAEQQEDLDIPKPNLEVLEELKTIITAPKTEECIQLFQSTTISRVKTEVISDKQKRSRVHELIRQAFHSKLETTTEDSAILVQKMNKKSRKRRDFNAGKTEDFVVFTLYKENKDTLEAVNTVAKFLHCPAKAFAFAGTKDRRAATTQRISWRRGTPARIMGLNNALHESIRVGDCKFEKNGLRLGSLTGNQFEIVIRNINSNDKAVIDAAFTSLRENGFINYFGLQRFGTFSVSSHEIGKYILCEDYDKAVDGLLNPQEITNEGSRAAREVWFNERDAVKALELMPRRCAAETSVLTALCESPSSINALLKIPRSLKTMYLHAYQSYVWNCAASYRIKLDPYNVLMGDLVYDKLLDGVQRARPVTLEEINEGKFKITDIVLPTPGFDVIYPENIVHVYESVMMKDGIDCHQMKRKIKEFSLYGTYRYALAKPLFLSWEYRRYANPEDTIVYTDREALEMDTKLAPEPKEGEEPKHAVVLKLGLATSQYATMALREVMKRDTGRHGNLYFE